MSSPGGEKPELPASGGSINGLVAALMAAEEEDGAAAAVTSPPPGALPQYVPVVPSEIYLPATPAPPTGASQPAPLSTPGSPHSGRHHHMTSVWTVQAATNIIRGINSPGGGGGGSAKKPGGGDTSGFQCKLTCLVLIIVALLVWVITYTMLYFVYEDKM